MRLKPNLSKKGLHISLTHDEVEFSLSEHTGQISPNILALHLSRNSIEAGGGEVVTG